MTRRGWLLVTALSALAAIGSAAVKPSPSLIWNASASTPIGLYAVRPARALHEGELVVALPPERVARFLSGGAYLPRGVSLVKHVLALPGQTVCRHGLVMTLDGASVGIAQARDRRGRDLPAWHGCRTIAAGEVFLMNPGVADSLDGRYFGPLPASSILGRAVPLWTDDEGNGRFVWRARHPLKPQHRCNGKDTAMAHIGAFTRTADGYSGRLRTLTLDIELTLVPADASDAETAPDFRVHLGDSADGPEVGAGWKRVGEKAGQYVALVIDDPAFTQPIRANLFQAEAKGSRFHLLWNRPTRRDERS